MSSDISGIELQSITESDVSTYFSSCLMCDISSLCVPCSLSGSKIPRKSRLMKYPSRVLPANS